MISSTNTPMRYHQPTMLRKFRRFLKHMRGYRGLTASDICRKSGIREIFFRKVFYHDLFRKSPPLRELQKICQTFSVDINYFLDANKAVNCPMFLKDVVAEGFTLLNLIETYRLYKTPDLFGMVVGKVAGTLSSRCVVSVKVFQNKSALITLELASDHPLAGIKYFIYANEESGEIRITHFRQQEDLTEEGNLLNSSYIDVILKRI